jgi:hypothetical protein
MREMSDAAFERYAEFLRADPIESILARNLSFLLDDNKLVSAVKLDTSLKNRTENGQIVLGGAPYLLRDDFDGRHWTAGLRVLLAHEVQHDNSSDADALKRVRENAESLFAEQGFRPFVGRILGQRLMNILEDARVNNIICRRFPGYIPMLRFVNYARTDAAIHGGALEEFFSELERFALTGTARDLEADIKERIDKAAISRDCAECETICNELLALLMPRLAAMCRAEDDLSAVLEKLNADLEDYAFSADTRAEQRGDGKDSYLRSHAEAETERKGTPDDGDDADGDKGDSASPGSGDNSKRYGDMNGSLTGSDVKPKASAGTDGREDRGASSSAGRSTNHGQSSSIGIKNDSGSALGKAAAEGPNSVREVIGADFSRRRSAALSELELKQMLSNAAADLLRERRYEKMSAVQTAGIGRLSLDDKFRLGGAYSDVKFEESSIVPSRRRLPPEYAEKARQMHKRLDRILREQRIRSLSQRRGVLSESELWKIPLGSKHVFKSKTPPKARETAFFLLIDRSGSMGTGLGNGNSKLFTALMTAAMIEEALKGIAYTKIVAFDGGPSVVEHCVIKDFEQKEIGSRCFDATTQLAAGNGNKDGYSIRAASMELVKRCEKRRILVVLSDGLPSAYRSEDEAIEDVRSAVHEAKRRGIVVIPVIYSADASRSIEAYTKMYGKSIVLASDSSIMSEFEKMLIKLASLR